MNTKEIMSQMTKEQAVKVMGFLKQRLGHDNSDFSKFAEHVQLSLFFGAGLKIIGKLKSNTAEGVVTALQKKSGIRFLN